MKEFVLMSALGATVLTSSVVAQRYPSKPLRILVGFSPGGASDITTRILGQKLAETFGQPGDCR